MRVVVPGQGFQVSARAGEGAGEGEAANAEVEYGDLGGGTGRLGRREDGRGGEWKGGDGGRFD